MQGSVRVVVAALSIVALPLGMMPPLSAETAGAGTLEGKVFAGTGGPVPGAVVLVHRLGSDSDQASVPTRQDGSYRLEGLPAGEYQVAVRTEKGLYLGARSLLVTEAAPQSYSFRIEDRPGLDAAALAAREPEEGSAGEGQEQQEKKKRKGGVAWWDNPLVVLAAGLAFVITTGAVIEAADDEDDEDDDGSPGGP